MAGFLVMLIPVVAILIAAAWGFFIGIGKVRARAICVATCFVYGLVAAIIVKNIPYETIVAFLDPKLAGQTGFMGELWGFLKSSEPLQQVIAASGGAILAPIVFALVFLINAILSWVVFLILALVQRGERKRAPIRTLVYAAVQMLLTVFVLMTPISAYLSYMPTLLDAGTEMGMIKADSEYSEDMNATQLKKTVEDANKSPIVVTYRALGGNFFTKQLTSFRVGEEKTNLGVELEAIGNFTANIYKLTKSNIKDYGADEAEAIQSLTDCFGESVLLPTVAGEIIYGATDAWLAEEGRSFLGIAKPKFEDSNTAMLAEPFDHILEAFHKDAKNSDALCRDFDTLGNMVAILAKDGVFANMNESDTTALVTTLSGGTTIQSLVVELGKNDSFKILISDITNIGMRAIGSSLKIPENAEEIYAQFTDDIATAMNSLMVSEKTEEEKRAELISEIKDAFAESGNELTLDDGVLGLYADTLLEDFADYETVTSNDVAEFFQVFAEVSQESTLPEGEESVSSNRFATLGSVTVQQGEKKPYTSPAYAGKTTEELKASSGAGLLATVMQGVIEAGLTSTDEESFRQTVETVLTDAYLTYAKANNQTDDEAREKAERFTASVKLTTESVTADTVKGTADMRSSETLKEITVRVTVEDLLVDSKTASERLDSEQAVQSEAEAIQNIFGNAGTILDKVNGGGLSSIEDLSEVAGSLGSVLDHLNGTTSVGEENTGKLVIAVFQSETVRESAKLDIGTATELGKAATEKDENGNGGSFTETMESIAAGAELATKLEDENAELTEEDIEKLLKNMTPQTAKMLKVYMTVERIKSFGVSDENAPITTDLLCNLFDEMGNKEKYGDSYQQQTGGILTIFQMTTAVSESDGEYAYLFNHTLPEGKVIGRLNRSADEVVEAILGTDMVCNAILKTRSEHPEWKTNPFGLSLSQENKEHADYKATKAAIETYYESHHEKGEELQERIYAIADFLGLDHSEIEFR